MKIRYADNLLTLEDEPLDVGYRTEKITAYTLDGDGVDLGGQTGATQVIFTLPHDDPSQIEEILSLLPHSDDKALTSCIITAQKPSQLPEGVMWLIDQDRSFADAYGISFIDGDLKGLLTKSVMVITKDGSLFYSDIPSDLTSPFRHDTLKIKINAAVGCYTGKGCH